ncbi:MAG: putative 4-hydroxybenzoate polyprenyltransferase [Pseudomonadota bacterium]
MPNLHSFLEAIKFSHTVFAMPFALLSAVLAFRTGSFDWIKLIWIVAAMVGARTWAMSINRVVDAHFDALNPRTAARAVAAGSISKKHMLGFGALGAVLFVGSASALSQVAFLCSFPVLLILASYSYTKRFTFLCHFWLGLCLSLAPLGAWVALQGTFPLEMLFLMGGITAWVGGFDIIYAIQDAAFDAQQGLHSIPSRFGIPRALLVARISHILAALFFATFGVLYRLGAIYFVGLAVAAILMVQQHLVVRKGKMDNINFAFFNLNGWIAVLLFLAATLSVWLSPIA